MSSVPNGSPVGHGVQVVTLGSGKQHYQVDVEALRSILLRDDVRDRSVVVVSVAGAYRGGKSFILDFFLRYLNASRSSQQVGDWLGKEDQPLEGFHWRGGGDRDTTGIHLWSEPILTTLERTGEKVAVLLMDTQGTFDTESTIAENSTIFALSTLISSVQIYNLSGNIKEDDLQHLQLFTEYGRLACDGDGKAFQTLMFLVRDWMNDYEQAHGFAGGKELLDKRLESRSNQKPQLREVREHIRSCFDDVKCFLMPHPGLDVGRQTFNGSLKDLTEKFRLALLELVPSLFDPRKLSVKMINGDRVRAKDLLDYFQRYVDIFNSDEMPEAVTIFKATADACLNAAVREARELYESRMEQRCVRADVSVTRRALRDCHGQAMQAAIEQYDGKKKLGAPEDIVEHLNKLTKELEACLSLYTWNNDAKVRDTLANAKKAYEDTISGVCEVQAYLCLHPLDLKALNDEATSAALTQFDSGRDVAADEEDDERTGLMLTLDGLYEHLCNINAQNNRSAVMEAREQYVTSMKLRVDVAGTSSDLLASNHQKAANSAAEHFLNKRNRPSNYDEDEYMESLTEEMETCFLDFEKLNLNSNRMAMQVAEYKYNNYIASAWGPQTCCFHPRALANLHRDAKQAAVRQFLANRTDSENDDFGKKLEGILEDRYKELVRVNEFNNNQALEQAFTVYTTKMDKHSQPSLVSIFIAPFIVKLLAGLPLFHTKSRRAAISEFMSKRRGEDFGDDEYYDRLLSKMDAAYQNYRSPLLAIMRELGLPVDN
ncbi:unnamed protein product [Chrysodeixis includens]|uniref:GB1/RHD3-type G domain-containing protein n=1 Tax=Chrysodeixis includens TaxID=689277 RepID=A0A9P0BV96_CHRIL|nr:unnamed protein product [Chrysodeixis includens]